MAMITQEFLINWRNYEYGVWRVIPEVIPDPDTPGGRELLDAFGDELGNILFSRSRLEETFAAHPRTARLAEYRARIVELDQALRSKQAVILALMPPDETNFWQNAHRRYPPSHWWWYLDQPDTVAPPMREEVIPVHGGRLAVTLDPALAGQVGLHPGQAVTVHVVDDKHLVITLP